jgi:hypothetical protein
MTALGDYAGQLALSDILLYILGIYKKTEQNFRSVHYYMRGGIPRS